MKITINREYMLRHLFVVALMTGLSGWFGYDGFVRYPQMDAADLYASIERDAPPPSMTVNDLFRFKEQKVGFQRMFSLVLLVFGGVVGVRLWKSCRFDLAYDETGFTVGGARYAYDAISRVDDSDWEKKGIARLTVNDRRIVLDSWHHVGIKEFYEKVKTPIDSQREI